MTAEERKAYDDAVRRIVEARLEQPDNINSPVVSNGWMAGKTVGASERA